MYHINKRGFCMKSRLISGIIFLALGLLIALGPQMIFPVCRSPVLGEEAAQSAPEKDMGMSEHNTGNTEEISFMNAPMKCHWTARAELGTGLLIAIESLLLILLRSSQIRFGLNLAIGLNGILALLFPTVLIGVCGSTRMNCRSLTLPALVIISGLVIAVSLINGIYIYQTDRIGGRTHGPETADDRAAVKK